MENSGELVHIGRPKRSKVRREPNPKRASRGKGVYIHTFGCQMNVYDSEKLALLLESDFETLDSPEDADLILVNTCSIREKAEHKLYSLVGGFKNLKERNPDLLIGVGGCVAQQEGKNILSRSPLVDFVFGTHNLSEVPNLVARAQSGVTGQVAVEYRDEWEELPLAGKGGRASTFVSISRGCNKNCTYCVVPTTRGPEVSRPVAEILQEIRLAAIRGVREVTLLGQTVNSYGLDLLPRMKFSELLELVAEIEGIERIRFTSPHPQEIRSDFFEILENNPKVCKHIHMPMQSGSDPVLKAMNRNYRMKKFYSIVEGVRAACPEVAISTDIIVGFPGESDSDFEATLEAMERIRFDSSYSFAFSERPGTKAAEFTNQLPLEVRKERLARLQALQDQHTQEKLDSWLGRETEVLVDGFMKSAPQRVQGRNSQNILIHFDSEYDDLGPGVFVSGRITRASRYTLHAERIRQGVSNEVPSR
ncbi:MAG: tRNA (N6-isopentenyl adenosine(37)-C2)-methylthiotransferase MiaB [Bdellovibrionales bacterium]|nr:tRNA (N6-isopentenyl adenosine(37)-C2)-methylthiotransferase MiaB [Bdellovibrionales bacterium]